MARVDAFFCDVHQPEPINLEGAKVLATFDKSCDTVTRAREKQRSEMEDPDFDYWSYSNLCNSDDDQCGCHSAFGKDDDGEVRHLGLDCEYDGF